MRLSKLALVGLGSIGRRHLRLIHKIRPDIDVILVRSGIGEHWPEEKLAHRIVRSVNEAVSEQVQAAVIASPSSLHIEQSQKFAEKKIHLLIEKPLSNNRQGIDELIDTVTHHKIVALVGYIFRYDPGAKRFREIIEGNYLGNLVHAHIECGSYLPEWRPDQNYKETASACVEKGGGVLLELSHEIDYMRWFLGEISSVQALIYNSGLLGINVEESADLIFETKQGMPVSMHLDFNRRHPSRFCKLQGENGELVWDALQKKIIWRLADGEIKTEAFPMNRDYCYIQQLTHFFDCIENKSKPAVSITDAAATLKLIEAAKRGNKIAGRVILS